MDVLHEVLSVLLLVFGLSYLMQSRAWAKISKEVIEKPESLMMMTWAFLPAGLALIAVHNIWVADLTVVFTILGWIITVKMVLFLLFPKFAQGFAGWSEDLMRKAIIGSGVVLTILGALLVYRFVISG